MFAFVCGLLLAAAGSVFADDGTRPRNLIVRSDGSVLATSMGSDRLTQLTWTGAAFAPPQYVDVGGRSWGVCLLDDTHAAVSLPLDGELVLLAWNDISARWEFDSAVEVPYYCNDLIKSPVSDRHVFVANRGRPPAVIGAQEWQHAVYEVDLLGGGIVRTFVTDREPRTLALSPDGTRLFVGHVQGALGGPAFDVTVGTDIIDHPLSNPIYDGGSVIVFDIADGRVRPVHRFGVGSPVRGLAVLPAVEAYRVYFSHVGFGAAGEDVQFGGSDIPNLITSIGFDATNTPVDRQDFSLGHSPQSEARRGVLPEKLIVRVRGGQRELWIANSGSGTVARVRLKADGSIDAGGQTSVTFPRILPGVPRPDGGWLLDANMTSSVADFATVAIDTVRGDSVTFFLTGDITSNPRSLVYDGQDGRDRVLVVTNLAHKLVAVQAGPPTAVTTTSLQPNGMGNPVSVHERNFFTFGRGFDFREIGIIPGSEQKVNNFTCGTCHVDGHIDGKIRFTVRAAENIPPELPSGSVLSINDLGKPVHVSTVFDMGATEWMFFEGLKTIRDGIDPREPQTTPLPDTRCGYCLFGIAGFFFDTDEFTREVETPMSPYAPAGVLTPEQNEGRLLFEAMNCTRCHMGATRQKYPRTQEAAENLPLNDVDFTANGQFGPAPIGLETQNRLLHDPTQVFFKNDMRVCPPPSTSSEFMNMTDVGTRNAKDGQVDGINTPALAGAWDNRPYMHDGRYRTLTEVLRHTYLDADDGHRAAPLVYEGVPDNANGGALPDAICDLVFTKPLFPFGTHRDYGSNTQPGNLVPVLDYLTSIGKLATFIDFLGAVSAQTDLCAGESNIPDVLDEPAAVEDGSMFDWVTLTPVECRVRWGLASEDALPNEIITPLATSHSVVIPTSADGVYRIVVTANTRGLCVKQPAAELQWIAGDVNATARNTLQQNEPNPFNPETTIHYSIDRDSHVSLIVYDVNGKRVRTLVNEQQRVGAHDVGWSGLDDRGSRVSSGVYFYRIRTPVFTQTRKMLFLK